MLASDGLAVKLAYGIVAVRTFQALSRRAKDCQSLDQYIQRLRELVRGGDAFKSISNDPVAIHDKDPRLREKLPFRDGVRKHAIAWLFKNLNVHE
jgi:hypothetical protein